MNTLKEIKEENHKREREAIDLDINVEQGKGKKLHHIFNIVNYYKPEMSFFCIYK